MSDAIPTMQPLLGPGSAPALRERGEQRRPGERRPPDAARRRVTLLVMSGAIALAAALALAGSLIGDPRVPTVWIEPFALPVEAVEPNETAFAVRLLEETRALAARARNVDEFASAPLADAQFEIARGVAVATARALRGLAGARDASVVGELTFTPEHADILVRDKASRASLRSRVARGERAIAGLAALGAEDVLLLSAPLHVAALALVDPRGLSDASRLDEIATMIARHPGLADDPRTALLEGARAAAHDACSDALGRFDRVIAAQPQAARAYALAADCLARLGRRDAALARLSSAAEHAGESASALSLAGDAYRRVGQPVRSLELLRVAYLKDPKLPQTAIAIGQTLLALHRPAESLAWLSSHPVDEAWRPRWLGVVGVAQVRSGQGPAAEATAATLRARDPASVDAIRIEAELAAATKAWPQALGRFNALRLLAPSDGEARAGEGRTLIALQRMDDAIAAYRACIDAAPWLAECRLGLGIALREADDAEGALSPLAEAAALDALDPRIPAETARTLRALQRRDEAASYATRADVLAQRLQQRLTLP
jgi:tetratricopeptide (TPR) repeat protein